MRRGVDEMKYPEFAKWLEEKFLEWQSRAGTRKTLGQFADWLGVKRATLSQWWVGNARPSPEYAFILGKHLGIEIYQQLGVVAPDQTLFDIMCHWDNMSETRRKELAKVLSKDTH
jgi:predicted transcriptional regulator